MKIDSHQHFWKYDPVRDSWIDESMQNIRRDFFPSHLKPLLKENNIDGCIAVQADQSEKESKFLLDLADENPFIKGVVGWIDLCDDNVGERLAYFSQHNKFKGVRHILQAEAHDFLLKEEFVIGISKLEKFDLVYDILICKEQLANTILLVKQFPHQKFVLDHSAKPAIKDRDIDAWSYQIKELAESNNVYCKVSGLVTEADWKNNIYEDFVPYLDVVFDSFGTKRVLFGSDWPVCLIAGDYKNTLGIIQRYISKFTAIEQQHIMGINAINVYDLNQE